MLRRPRPCTEGDFPSLGVLPYIQEIRLTAIKQGAKAFESTPCFTLYNYARDHAKYMALVHRQGHQDWQSRFHQIRHDLDNQFTPTEICAESWYWEADSPPHIVAKSFIDSWRASRGHWSVASQQHAKIGFSLSQSTLGIWYCCTIVAD